MLCGAAMLPGEAKMDWGAHWKALCCMAIQALLSIAHIPIARTTDDGREAKTRMASKRKLVDWRVELDVT